MKNKPWSGRFKKEMNKKFEKFSQSVSFDQRLALYDVRAGKAHIDSLLLAGIISKSDAQRIQKGLAQIESEILSGKFEFREEMEDVHMNIESRLFELIGETAGKLHTGRSRNDLVVTDLRLWLKDEIREIENLIKALIRELLDKAELNLGVIMPGLTHTRFAQPVIFSHWLMAYVEMLSRDLERMARAFHSANICPLGSGALAGTNYQIDRRRLAKALGFESISENSIDAVSDRDFLIEFVSASAILMMHLSRLSEELIWLSGEGFRFIELPESLCTGSSIMPNKKNPDSAELLRGKTGRVYGHLLALLTIMKATPLAYNRDFQEDKEPVFDTADTVKDCLEMMCLIIAGLKPNPDAMRNACDRGFILATDLADYLVKKGMGFRQAHHTIGTLVRYCEEQDKRLEDLTLEEFQNASKLFDRDVYRILSLETSVNSKSVIGGTSRPQVRRRIKMLQKVFKK